MRAVVVAFLAGAAHALGELHVIRGEQEVRRRVDQRRRRRYPPRRAGKT
jgi:hypothetical protein